MDIEVPKDRLCEFEPQIVKKRQKDISDIDRKIISLYAKKGTRHKADFRNIYGYLRF